jgi:hypothetical protein
MLRRLRSNLGWATAAATAATTLAVACGGNVAGGPGSPGGDPHSGGRVPTNSGSSTSNRVNNTATGNGSAWVGTGYGVGVTTDTTVNHGTSDSTHSCITYSCGLSSANCAGTITIPKLPDGCYGPCQCSEPIDPPPPLDASVTDVAVNGVSTFQLAAAPGTSFCAVVTTPVQGGGWLSIDGTSASDGGSAIFALGATVSCGACYAPQSQAIVASTIVPGMPIQYVWDGQLQAGALCGEDAGARTCTFPLPTPAGSYVAHMCAWTDCSLDPQTAQYKCIDVPFAFPLTGPVIGVLD